MSFSPKQQIDSIIHSLAKKGTGAPFDLTMALVAAHPEAVSDLAMAVIERHPDGGTFLDAAYSFMPQIDWPGLVTAAMDALEQAKGKNEAADSVISYAALQCHTALHSHLERIFHIRPNKGAYYECCPWRESGEEHIGFLKNIIENEELPDEDRRRAWTALFQTRNLKAIKYATTLVRAKGITKVGWTHDNWLKVHLHQIGFEREKQSFKRICPEELYHLRFPEDFFEEGGRPSWLAKVHPTWQLPKSIHLATFGGSSKGNCSVCGDTLHRLLRLEKIPPGLGITELKKLELATCLSCLGWEQDTLFCQHKADGSPQSIAYDGPLKKPQFPVGPLKEAEIDLALTPRRWYWQDWALSNSRENLHRLGGEPSWIQDAIFPDCPGCQKVMSFLIQLDSDLPAADGGEWLWGSGGIGYGFWCDDCKVSGFHWQCT